MEQVVRAVQKPETATVKVIAITGGKGGIGKTSVSINLAVALANSGQNVMLLDADLGLANVDVMLGLHCDYNLSHLLDGEYKLADIVVRGPSNIYVVPAASGIQRMAKLSAAEHTGLIHAFSEFNERLDTLVIDTAAGITDSVVTFSRAAHEVIVVVCDEPASITDAYALIKILNRDHEITRFRVLANMVESAAQGSDLYTKLLKVTNRFLDVNLDYIGIIPGDDYLRKSVQKRLAVVNAFPRSRSATAFSKLAAFVNRWPTPHSAEGRLEFFLERLVSRS